MMQQSNVKLSSLFVLQVLEAVTMAQQNTTESILCNHILNAWLNLSNKKKEDITREGLQLL